VRIVPMLLLALLVPASSAAAQQVAPPAAMAPAAAHAKPDREAVAAINSWRLQAIGSPVAAAERDLRVGPEAVELNARRRVNVTGLVIGAVVGAAVGGALACLANRDDYGVYCAGQNDTKVVIGAVIGAGVGGWIGGFLIPRRS
jgi:hypothetical protein